MSNKILVDKAALEGLRMQHHECGDPWYSCPKSEDGCCNDDTPKDECTCGADEHNTKIEMILKGQAL